LANDGLKAGNVAWLSVFQYWPSTMPPLALKTPVENGAADDVNDVVVVDVDNSVEEVTSTVEDVVSEIDERTLLVEDEDIDIDGSEMENETETLDLDKGVVNGPVADEEATREEDTRRLDVESIWLGTDVLETSPELLDTTLDLLMDDDDGLGEVPALTFEIFDDVDEDVVVETFDEVLDETFDDDLNDELMTTFEELEDPFDELFDEDLDDVLDNEDEVFVELGCVWSQSSLSKQARCICKAQ
jgi:hypothetical protein